MNILTEYELRAKCLPTGTESYSIAPGVFVTPMAAEYLRDRGIRLEIRSAENGVMPQTKLGDGGRYRLPTGELTTEKPEEMTHLRGNLLVPKCHPRILLRGKLDSLEAKILETQVTAMEEGFPPIAADLEELYLLAQRILGAEVKETPLGEFTLLGLDSKGLRRASHQVKEELGIDHPVPHYSMGRLCVALNALRTAVRETELAAAVAFQENMQQRLDLIEALNRMSSCVYLLFCRKLAGFYGEKRLSKDG